MSQLDSTLPMKTTLIQSSNPGLLLALPKLLKAIHVEIEAFCIQVLICVCPIERCNYLVKKYI